MTTTSHKTFRFFFSLYFSPYTRCVLSLNNCTESCNAIACIGHTRPRLHRQDNIAGHIVLLDVFSKLNRSMSREIGLRSFPVRFVFCFQFLPRGLVPGLQRLSLARILIKGFGCVLLILMLK